MKNIIGIETFIDGLSKFHDWDSYNLTNLERGPRWNSQYGHFSISIHAVVNSSGACWFEEASCAAYLKKYINWVLLCGGLEWFIREKNGVLYFELI